MSIDRGLVIKPWLVAGVTGLVAVGLLLLTVPRTIAAFLTMPSTPILRKLQNLQPVSVEELDVLVASQKRGLFWESNGRARTDLGLGLLLSAERLPRGSPEMRQQLEQAVAALREGLAIAPANPYAWARLAYAEALLRGWTPLALSSLRLAFVTAPYEPRLVWSRLRLNFLAWPQLSEEDRQIVFQQIRFAWDNDPKELTRLAVESNQANVVRAALVRNPDDSASFEELLKKQAP